MQSLHLPTLTLLLLTLTLILTTTTTTSSTSSSSLPPTVKFYHPLSHSFVNESLLWQEISSHSVIFLGEEHDHVYGHYMEHLILERLIERHREAELLHESHHGRGGNAAAAHGNSLALSLEMFERDTQDWLTNYLSNDVSQQAFLSSSRPWPNYDTAYKPLVESMKTHQFSSVLAANVPRRYAHHVTLGLEKELFDMPDVELTYMAQEILAPQKGTYWDKFYELFKDQMPLEKIVLYYRAQCLKDDTMARSIEEWWNASSTQSHASKQVLSCTGGFHVENFAGLYEKVGLKLGEQVSRYLISIRSYDPSKPFPDLKEFENMGDLVIFMPPKRE